MALGQPNDDRLSKRRAGTRRDILDAAWEVAATTGLAGITLREIAVRVGMRPPSLYSHFDSKLAIYDAMFGDAWQTYEARVDASAADLLVGPPRTQLKQGAAQFLDFAVEMPARYELMNRRTVPGFTPSAASYEPAVRVLQRFTDQLTALGVDDPAATDLWVAIVGGLVDSQLANDPGGDRWRRLLDRATDMYADAIGLPPTTSATPEQKGTRP